MYFGALAVGADVAGGIYAFYFDEKASSNVSCEFKGIKADFIKRAESDILFKSSEGLFVKQAIELIKSSVERVNQNILVNPIDQNQEVVATFEMVVSVKCK
jgi:hypothetical protein